jgi:hypothetical protein
VSSISQSGYVGSSYEPRPGAIYDNNEVQKIAPVDAKPNNKLTEDKFTPTINLNKNGRTFETYNSSGRKSTFSAIIAEEQNNIKENGSRNKAEAEKELTPEEKKAVEVLQKADKMVRAHEQAHKSVGGSLVRGGNFTYTTGPDGKVYATGGEVQIDISPVKNDPEATIRKMEKVRAAALAPVDPSAQDRSVAALAQSIAANARAEAMKQKSGNTKTDIGTKNKLMESYKNNDYINQSESSSQFTSIGGKIASLKG